MNKPTTKLERAVYRMIRNNADSTSPADLQAYAEDVLQAGCQSGIVGQLIYYTDTAKFYKRHAKEIDRLLAELCDDTGKTPARLFGNKWDSEDPMARDYLNQNLLAWFGFEEATRRMFDN